MMDSVHKLALLAIPDQLLDLAAIVRGEKPNDQDYDRDLRTHEITLKTCGLI